MRLHQIASMALVVLVVAHIGCRPTSNPSDNSIAEYFRAISTSPLVDKAFGDIGAILAEQRRNQSVEARIAAYSSYFKSAAPLMGVIARDLQAVTPPPEFERQHAQLISLVLDFQESMALTAHRLEEASTWTEAQGIAATQLTPLFKRMSTLCTEMRDEAEAIGIETSWRCLEVLISPRDLVERSLGSFLYSCSPPRAAIDCLESSPHAA